MKNKKIFIILLVIVLLLIAFFTTKIILEKKYNIDYKSALANETFSLYQVSYYENDEEIKITDMIMVLNFKDETLNICYLEECYNTTYKIKNDAITINKIEGSSIEEKFNIQYSKEDGRLILKKDLAKDVYVKYYLTKPMG